MVTPGVRRNLIRFETRFIVMGCDDEVIPCQERIEAVADDSDHPRSSEGLLFRNPHRAWRKPCRNACTAQEKPAPLRVLDGFRATANYAGARFPGCEVSLRVLQSFNAAAPVVYVEATVTEESDQRHPATLSGCYCQTGRGSDSS
jgi:hypothetical protein